MKTPRITYMICEEEVSVGNGNVYVWRNEKPIFIAQCCFEFEDVERVVEAWLNANEK